VYLFTGVLIERIKAQVERLQQQYPQIAFALGTHFGFDKGIFELLDSKVDGGELPKAACSNATAASTAKPPRKNICTTTATPPCLANLRRCGHGHHTIMGTTMITHISRTRAAPRHD
jgi:sirohydrochlorin cobaltochelatase